MSDKYVIFNDDCLEALKQLPDDSLDSLITDPPAGISFMGKDWEKADWKSVNGNHHPTVKPLKLMQYLITMITPPGGTVLDPFMGSGSTGVAAVKAGFQFIGIEKEHEYANIAEKRLEHADRKTDNNQDDS